MELAKISTRFMLVREYKLSCYDTACLELAVRTQAIVGTPDRNLKKARIKAGLQAL
jgi:predicted nucleic acid-binding protein